MGFKSKEELGGIDPKINTKGRIAPTTTLNNRQLREKELLGLLRKLKPHMSDAIMAAVLIMKNKEASHQNQLKAATILLEQYKETLEGAYNKDYDEAENSEVNQDSAPVFSLKVVND